MKSVEWKMGNAMMRTALWDRWLVCVSLVFLAVGCGGTDGETGGVSGWSSLAGAGGSEVGRAVSVAPDGHVYMAAKYEDFEQPDEDKPPRGCRARDGGQVHR
jgi:hypothetical protein